MNAQYVNKQKPQHVPQTGGYRGGGDFFWRFPTIVNFSISKRHCVVSKITYWSRRRYSFNDNSFILCVSPQPLTFFTCMIFPVMDSAFPLLFLSIFLSHFLSLQLPALLSLGAYWHFSANLLFYAHINVCCLIRCAGGLEFHSTSLLTLLRCLWLIHPLFLCSERQAPLYKTPAVLSGRPHDPTVTAVENRGVAPPGKMTTGAKCVCVSVCVCVCVRQRESSGLFTVCNCLNTCDNTQNGCTGTRCGAPGPVLLARHMRLLNITSNGEAYACLFVWFLAK